MYLRAGAYPELRGLTWRQRRSHLRTAIAEYGKWYRRRMLVALPLCIVVLPYILHEIFRPAGLSAYLLGLLVAVCLYAYIVWEINGSVRRAFLKYLEVSGPAEIRFVGDEPNNSLKADGPDGPPP